MVRKKKNLVARWLTSRRVSQYQSGKNLPRSTRFLTPAICIRSPLPMKTLADANAVASGARTDFGNQLHASGRPKYWFRYHDARFQSYAIRCERPAEGTSAVGCWGWEVGVGGSRSAVDPVGHVAPCCHAIAISIARRIRWKFFALELGAFYPSPSVLGRKLCPQPVTVYT